MPLLYEKHAWLAPVLIAMLALAVLTQLNPEIGFGNGTGCDAWYFFGIYRHYSDFGHLQEWYQLQRYSALVPWIYIDPYLNGVDAVTVRMWTYFIVTALAFSYAAHRLFSPAAAAAALLLFVLGKLFLGALSTDYVSVAGAMWGALLLAATAQAALSARGPWWGLLCGLIAICALSTHLPVVLFIFSTPFLFFVNLNHWNAAGLVRFVGFGVAYLAGALAGAALLGAYSLSLGNDFLFLISNISAGAAWVGIMTTYRQTWAWIVEDANFYLLACVSVVSLVALATAARKALARDAAATQSAVVLLVFLAMTAAIFAWESTGLQALRGDVYAAFMYPMVFLAIGAILHRFAALRAARPAFVVAGSLAIAVVLVLAADLMTAGELKTLPFFLGGGAVLVVGLLLSERRFAAIAALAAWLTLGVVTFPPGYGREVWGSPVSWRSVYEIMDEANDFLGTVEFDRYPKFWMDSTGPATMFLPRTFMQCADYPGSFPSLHKNWGNLGSWFPAMGDIAEYYLVDGDLIVLTGSGSNLAATADAALEPLSIDIEPIAEHAFERSGAQGNSIAVGRVTVRSPES
ncbi:MAG: hypothetical protein AB7T59_19410 [Hyphomonadaceae bacterium]